MTSAIKEKDTGYQETILRDVGYQGERQQLIFNLSVEWWKAQTR